MPRSKDVRNYGPFYDQLAELMDRGESPITLDLPGKQAIYHRNNFYAYINAWKHRALSITTDKRIPTEDKQHLLEMAMRREEALRRYLVVITPELNQWEEDNPPVQLTFIIRGMDERQVNAIEQLTAIAARSTRPSYVEVKEQILGQPTFKAVDGKKVIDEWKEMAGGSIDVQDLDSTLSPEEAKAELNHVPEDRTDLTALVTADNPPVLPTSEDGAPPSQKDIFRMAETLHQKESENKS